MTFLQNKEIAQVFDFSRECRVVQGSNNPKSNKQSNLLRQMKLFRNEWLAIEIGCRLNVTSIMNGECLLLESHSEFLVFDVQ